MKISKFFIGVLITLLVGTTLIFSSCNKNNSEDENSSVTFGANYHIINCITTVSIYLDGEYIGTLENYTNEITACGEPENITKDILTGYHTYKVEIRGGCTRDIEGTFNATENGCEKVFIDYSGLEL